MSKRTRNQTLDRAGGRAGRMVCQGDTLMKDQSVSASGLPGAAACCVRIQLMFRSARSWIRM